MVPQDLISDVAAFVREQGALDTGCETGVGGLFAFCSEKRTEFQAMIYEPVMCLVLQGAKEAHLEDRTVRYGAGKSLIVSHALPVSAGVIDASQYKPYVSLALQLDLAMVRSLYDEIGTLPDARRTSHSMSVADGDAALFDAVGRLFRLAQDPVEVQALAPLVLKEIHFRLLRAQHGGMLRQLLLHESPASRITKAIALIREQYKSPLPVADLAAEAGMSQSTFHEHFKALTSTTPLQYQKELRLMEARRLLLGGGKSVASAAYDVGYESPTQFSREYVRKFGVPPRHEKLPSIPAAD
ncbi:MULTISPECIES: AraC family transcriptional regulator [unclassified Leisingera]|uniref:AraC family transcriptional regulator n=1 Tax=unclassified Leisingera TaxID=2614906 RepID=UPI00031212E5|nr:MULTISPECIES: AraC family transcriptional regulator [unclassified Leisingera]KIC23535.1 AraC family transcriptional regulator [Leisingera sp. ANG-S3]KIC54069.1 AraC family transcriptional regulator [Leisingera sp. ANG-S]KID09700.1 AraC family transcriptional regulator [Leisingera sp. ANG1]